MPEPRAVTTAYTLSLGGPEAMEAAARTASQRPLLKVKLGGDGDAERIAAVKRGAPKSTLIVDANEAWSEANFAENLAACRAADVALIEQPLPSGCDGMLASISAEDRGGIVFCADESVHTAGDLDAIASLYQAINIKLDKAGGLTAALQLKSAGARPRLEDHDRVHGRHVARDGARAAARQRRGFRRPRWPAASRPRPRARACVRWQRDKAF